MEYTILSAKYANEDRTAAVIETKEFGSVAISEADRPELWKLLRGVKVAGYVAPVVPPLPTLADQIAALPAGERAKIKAALSG